MTDSNLFSYEPNSMFLIDNPIAPNNGDNALIVDNSGDRDLLIIDNPGVVYYDNSFNNSTGNIIDDYQDDIIRGTDGNDSLIGTAGNDVFAESAGNDTLDGGDGNDKLRAGAGDDLLIGGKGVDTMAGGSGADLFRFDAIENKVDIIKDFSFSAGDSIEIMGESIDDSDKITYNLFSGIVSYEGQAVVNIGPRYSFNIPGSINVEPIEIPIPEKVTLI